MLGDGSWCLICFRHPSWLGICYRWMPQMFSTPSFDYSSWLGNVTSGCHKCFQHHLLKNHLTRALCDRKPIVSTFPFVWSFYAQHVPFFFSHLSFGTIDHHTFFIGHRPRWFACWASFCANPFSKIMMFYGVFSFLYFPFPCWWHSHH